MSDFQVIRDFYLNKNAPIQVFPATVKKVTGKTCTVDLLSADMEVPGVRLVADPDVDESVLITPKVGSYVLMACIENDVANAYVCQFSEIESVKIVIGDTVVTIDKDTVVLKNGKVSVDLNQERAIMRQDSAEVLLKGGQVAISTDGVSLKDLFSDLIDALKTFVVITPNGLSSGLGPTSTVALESLEIKVDKLLA